MDNKTGEKILIALYVLIAQIGAVIGLLFALATR